MIVLCTYANIYCNKKLGLKNIKISQTISEITSFIQNRVGLIPTSFLTNSIPSRCARSSLETQAQLSSALVRLKSLKRGCAAGSNRGSRPPTLSHTYLRKQHVPAIVLELRAINTLFPGKQCSDTGSKN